MTILSGFKTCRKGLHQYLATKRQCPECRKQAVHARYISDLNRSREINRKKYAATIERRQELDRNYKRNRYANNPERYRKIQQNWSKNNPDKLCENAARRRALQKQAIPPWANQSSIKKIYKECCELNKKTGIRHHVDHAYPLKSDYLCGLHVETNLQIILATENIQKNNRVWPGQLECQKQPVSAIFSKELTDFLND